MSLSIIILSYNTKELTRDCLASVFKYLPLDFFEVIVVDNSSNDTSSEMVRKDFPKIKLIQSAENLGFAKGINKGVKFAKADNLLFLNSDTKLYDATLVAMVNFLQQNKNIGVLGGLLTNLDGSPQRSFGKFYTLFNVFKMLLGGDQAEKLKTQLNRPVSVDWVSGGFMMIPKSVYEKMQGFDEHFFMYIEDMELCYRIKKSGYKVFAYPAKAIHIAQGSSNRSFAVINIYSGLVYFYEKHRNKIEQLMIKALLTAKALLLVIFGTMFKDHYLRETYTKALKSIY